MTPIIIDIEASGFGRGSYPIEVGFVLADGTPWCRLIRPEPEWTHWDPQAESVHHIRRSLLNSRGLPVREIAGLLNETLGGETVYCDGWGNDSSWLAMLFYHAGLPQRFRLDTLRSLLDEDQVAVWQDTRREVETELNLQRHRASSDALILQQTFVRSRERVLARTG